MCKTYINPFDNNILKDCIFHPSFITDKQLNGQDQIQNNQDYGDYLEQMNVHANDSQSSLGENIRDQPRHILM